MRSPSKKSSRSDAPDERVRKIQAIVSRQEAEKFAVARTRLGLTVSEAARRGIVLLCDQVLGSKAAGA